jgi:hypothetical protein
MSSTEHFWSKSINYWPLRRNFSTFFSILQGNYFKYIIQYEIKLFEAKVYNLHILKEKFLFSTLLEKFLKDRQKDKFFCPVLSSVRDPGQDRRERTRTGKH